MPSVTPKFRYGTPARSRKQVEISTDPLPLVIEFHSRSIRFTPHADGCADGWKRDLAVLEIFRIFSMAFVETSKTGCSNSLKNKHPHG